MASKQGGGCAFWLVCIFGLLLIGGGIKSCYDRAFDKNLKVADEVTLICPPGVVGDRDNVMVYPTTGSITGAWDSRIQNNSGLRRMWMNEALHGRRLSVGTKVKVENIETVESTDILQIRTMDDNKMWYVEPKYVQKDTRTDNANSVQTHQEGKLQEAPPTVTESQDGKQSKESPKENPAPSTRYPTDVPSGYSKQKTKYRVVVDHVMQQEVFHILDADKIKIIPEKENIVLYPPVHVQEWIPNLHGNKWGRYTMNETYTTNRSFDHVAVIKSNPAVKTGMDREQPTSDQGNEEQH